MSRKLFLLVILLLVSAPAFAQSVDTGWVRSYNGPGNYSDEARAIALDGSGNVCVTGESWGDGTNWDYATIKYHPSGDTVWVRRYNGPANDGDRSHAIAVDGAGCVYVTGESWGSGSNYDYATVKYDANGDVAWIRRYNGPGNSTDFSFDIAVDAFDNVYVTGVSEDSVTSKDYATIKYYDNGDTAWVTRYNGPGNDDDWAGPLAVDDSGCVYVTGYSRGVGTHDDYATVKYDPDGNELWVRRYTGPGSGRDWARAIAVDDFGNVYVTGVSVGSGTSDDYATIRYYPNGDTAWVRRYDGPVSLYDEAHAIAVDSTGNVYVTGYSSATAGKRDYATIMYDSEGSEVWVRRYNRHESPFESANAIAVDRSGKIYVTGESMDTLTYYDYATVSYDISGTELWVKRYDGGGGHEDRAQAISIDDAGNIYVTGGSIGSQSSFDYATAKYVQFLRGDVNQDGVVDIQDLIYLINYLYSSGPPPVPIPQVGDVNCDGVVDMADVVYLINYLLKDGPPPCE